MHIPKVKSRDAVATILDFIENKKFGAAYCVHDEKSVFVAESGSIDAEVCKELGYAVLETRHTGGGVVVNEGDISVVHFGRVGNEWMHTFAKYLIERYRDRGLDASFDGNDVLVGGYKISGLSATLYGHIQYSTIHVGINTNLDHIKRICKKPMFKVPKGLSEYEITTEDVEVMLLAFCEQNNLN